MKAIGIRSRATFTGILVVLNFSCGGGLKPSKESVATTEKTSGDTAKCLKGAAPLHSPMQLSATDPTWHGEIKTLILAKCSYCHGGKAGDPGPKLTTLAEVSARASEVLKAMKDTKEPMPPSDATPQLASGDIDLVTNWISDGKPEGTAPTASDTIDPNAGAFYYNNIKSLLDADCVVCHKSGGTSPDLSTYAAAKAAGALSLADIQAGSMPPAGALSADKVTLFKEWADAGYPEGTPGSSTTPSGTSTGNCP